ncbi:11439_t:CDS:2 [Racocetra fulgida]|uniref:11439_t:CDS:1 n=1 Tax=Racocetra fulgida TaxID=60492 RepID=A0A9N9BW41_9GLOM|nr:11439_t:CDS:2 [Racocetra fulgida]
MALSEVEPLYFGADGSGNSLFFAVLFALETPDALYVTDKYEVSYVTFCQSEEQSSNELVPSLRLEVPSGLQSQLSPAFEDCLKRIEKYFLKQVLSTTVDCIKCGVVINSGEVLVY